MTDIPQTILAAEITAKKSSIYPEPFASMMNGREKRRLADIFGIKKFGVNMTTLIPGARSALLHRHSVQEEFIYILEGNATLVTDISEIELKPGMCAGFTPNGNPHYLINKTLKNVVYLEVGDRSQDDKVTYPADDLVAISIGDNQWKFTHKDGREY